MALRHGSPDSQRNPRSANRSRSFHPDFHRSKSEALEIVAELKPVEAPPLREVVTLVHAVRAAPSLESPDAAIAPHVGTPPLPASSPEGFLENLVDASSPRADAHAPTSRGEREQVEPLTKDLRRLHLTVSRRLLEKLAAARDALSHARPDASTDEILEAGLDLLLAKAAKSKGAVAKPQKNPRPTKSVDHVPAHVKREVMERDDGKCQWTLPSGEICGRTRHIQLDHVKPLALGGLSTIDNVRLPCRPHNLEAARRAPETR